MRNLPMFVAVAGAVSALLAAPTAAATPDCVNTGPTTTLCQTSGHSQIVTSPPAMSNPFNGYPFGGFAIGFPW